ncbi:uncharacterized protein HD556DRAFT_1393797 [Suillus plorans]|uniref:Uncharacterized protein n=1 Tax=Suillus plorans TaxID=116603 RepID=A0A9P7AJB7_9AGAM|nr:uncharacterized protein HD556DRAFT_1393797 [Suillus plorans]KAG1790051.1 hypothetical protein HD556DRAFT_1393797 [Suillus plorans]
MLKVGLSTVMPGPKYMTLSRLMVGAVCGWRALVDGCSPCGEILGDGSIDQYADLGSKTYGLLAPVAPSESMLNVGDPTDNCWSNIMQFVSPGDASGLLSADGMHVPAEVLQVVCWTTGILAETTELLVPVKRPGVLGYESDGSGSISAMDDLKDSGVANLRHSVLSYNNGRQRLPIAAGALMNSSCLYLMNTLCKLLLK